jgi:hypothetical protein
MERAVEVRGRVGELREVNPKLTEPSICRVRRWRDHPWCFSLFGRGGAVKGKTPNWSSGCHGLGQGRVRKLRGSPAELWT